MKISQILTAHRGPVTSINVNQNILITGSSDGSCAIFSITQNNDKLSLNYRNRLFGHCQRGISAISYLDETVLIGADDALLLVNAQNNQKLISYKQQNSSAVAQTNDTVIVASTDASLRIFERASGQQLSVFRGHESAVLTVALFGDIIVTGGQDGKLVFYNTHGMTLHTMRFQNPISDIRFSPNGGFLAVCCLQSSVRVVKLDLQNLSSSSVVRMFDISEGKYLHQICFYDKQVIFGGEGKLIKFDLINSSTKEIKIENEDILAVQCIFQLNTVFAGCRSGRVYIIKINE